MSGLSSLAQGSLKQGSCYFSDTLAGTETGVGWHGDMFRGLFYFIYFFLA